MLRYILIIAVCLAATLPAYASDKARCTPQEAFQAENEVDKLNTWEDLHRMFERYGNCNFDHGVIAEGYSDIVGRLLADDWEDVLTLKKLCDTDTSFTSFVYKHLDRTISADTWETMLDNAARECPSGAEGICRMIEKAHDAVGKETGQGRQQDKD
jgi:hypothetical protein